MKKYLYLVLLIFVVGMVSVVVYFSSRSRSIPIPPVEYGPVKDYTKGIIVYRPHLYSDIENPVIIFGEAKSAWFSDGKILVTITDKDGTIVDNGEVVAKTDSKTIPAEEYIPFEGSVTYNQPSVNLYMGFLTFESQNVGQDGLALKFTYKIQFPYDARLK